MSRPQLIDIGWPASELHPSSAPVSRLPQFIGLRGDARQRLRSFRLGVIGAGSVGGNIAMDMARLGIGELIIVDRGRFKAESLQTHAILPDLIGQPKASSMGRICKMLCPSMCVRAFDGPVQSLPRDTFADADVVALASDNLPTEGDTGETCAIMPCRSCRRRSAAKRSSRRFACSRTGATGRAPPVYIMKTSLRPFAPA